MEMKNAIDINSSIASKFIHDVLPAIIAWLILLFLLVHIAKPTPLISSIFVGFMIISLSCVIIVSYKQSKTYKLDLTGITIMSNSKSITIPWDNIESIAKVGRGESMEYEALDKAGKKYSFPLDTKIGRTESFFDSLIQITPVSTKNTLYNYHARWKNSSSPKYIYTSFSDRFMDFSYGQPN